MRRPLDLLAPRPVVDLVLDGAALAAVAYAGARGWAGAGELIPYLALMVALHVSRVLARRARRQRPRYPAEVLDRAAFRLYAGPGWSPPITDPDTVRRLFRGDTA